MKIINKVISSRGEVSHVHVYAGNAYLCGIAVKGQDGIALAQGRQSSGGMRGIADAVVREYSAAVVGAVALGVVHPALVAVFVSSPMTRKGLR